MAGLILIVDDREDDSFLLERMLRRMGVANPVTTLTDGSQAIAYLAGEPFFRDREQYPLPSVMFLDLKMPGRDGFDVLEWLQAHPLPEKCLVLIVSELHASADLHRAYGLGADSFLCKPLDEVELRECLRNHPHCWDFATPVLK